MFHLTKAAARHVSYRWLSTSVQRNTPVVAVVLSGAGVYDGTEIHEASAAFVGLSRAGADIVCYAPDIPQMHVVDHSKGSPVSGESRNVLSESARISRGNIKPLKELSSKSADAVIFPGGFGAAKNLCNFAVKSSEMEVDVEVERVLVDFHKARKPIGMCCIAPVLAAKVFGRKGVALTVGKADDGSGKWPYAGTIEAVKAMGAKHVEKGVNEISVDEVNKIITTPAFMYEGKFHEIHDGVAKMAAAVVALIGKT